jgi:hypothetical protein
MNTTAGVTDRATATTPLSARGALESTRTAAVAAGCPVAVG